MIGQAVRAQCKDGVVRSGLIEECTLWLNCGGRMYRLEPRDILEVLESQQENRQENKQRETWDENQTKRSGDGSWQAGGK